MTFTDTVKTITREQIVPKVFDTVLNGNVGLLRLLGNARAWGSGYRLDVPIKFQKSTVGGLVGLGGTLDTSRSNTRVKMQFEPKRRHKPVVVDDIEVQLNKGDEQVLMLLATEMDSVAMDLLNEAGTDFYEGTGGSGDQFDSILNSSDDSTNFATYGSLARSTYTTIKGYLATSIGTLALSDLSTFHSNIKIGAAKPSLILADTISWTAYEGLLQPTVRAGYEANGFPQVTRTGEVPSQRALQGELGFDAIWYRGTPVVEDEKVTSGYMFGLNERQFQFHGIDIDEYEKVNISDANIDGPQSFPVPRGFNWTGLLRSQSQPAEVGHLYIIGNFVSKDPRRTGNLQGITG
jgi:hypothetical protein